MTAFEPSAHWQEVPDGAILPPGLQVEVDVATGRKRARKMPCIIPDVAIPAIAELAARKQWVCWSLEEREGGKWTKVPKQPNGRVASSTDARTWRSFDECRRAAENGAHAGVGYVFAEDDGYGEIDLDHVIEGDVVFDWALAIVRLARTYTEVSQGGEGLHLVMRTADIPKGFERSKHAGSVAGATQGRFLALTGRVFSHPTIRHDCAAMADADLGTLMDHPLFVDARSGNGHAPNSERGGKLRAEEGSLGITVSPDRGLRASDLTVILDNLPDFRAIWTKRARPAQDGTHSGYMASIARRLCDLGKDDQFIADALVEFCRLHLRMDKADHRQVERAIIFAKQHEKIRTPAAADKMAENEAEEDAAVERMEECRDDRGEALRELSSHFGVALQDVKRMGNHPGRVMFKVDDRWHDVGTPTQVLSQSPVINALHHARLAVVRKVKPDKWLRVATLIMLHQRVEDSADEEEVQRIEEWISGLNMRSLEADKSMKWRKMRMSHVYDGHVLVFPGSEGLDSRSLGLNRTIYTVLKEAGFEPKKMGCDGGGGARTSGRSVWRRPIEKKNEK